MAGYTPGPWKYDPGAGCKRIKGGKSGAHRQAQYNDVAYTVGCYREEVDEANARLIAAAPELLEALEALADSYFQMFPGSIPDYHQGLLNKADAAMKKARGD